MQERALNVGDFLQFWVFARALKHPSARDNCAFLPAEWQAALDFQMRHCVKRADCTFEFKPLIDERKHVMRHLMQLSEQSQQFQAEQKAWRDSLHPDVQAIIGKVKFPLLPMLTTVPCMVRG